MYKFVHFHISGILQIQIYFQINLNNKKTLNENRKLSILLKENILNIQYVHIDTRFIVNHQN